MKRILFIILSMSFSLVGCSQNIEKEGQKSYILGLGTSPNIVCKVVEDQGVISFVYWADLETFCSTYKGFREVFKNSKLNYGVLLMTLKFPKQYVGEVSYHIRYMEHIKKISDKPEWLWEL